MSPVTSVSVTCFSCRGLCFLPYFRDALMAPASAAALPLLAGALMPARGEPASSEFRVRVSDSQVRHHCSCAGLAARFRSLMMVLGSWLGPLPLRSQPRPSRFQDLLLKQAWGKLSWGNPSRAPSSAAASPSLMAAPPGDAGLRRPSVVATATRTAADQEERNLGRQALVAAAAVRPCDVPPAEIKRALAMRLKIRQDELQVSPLANNGEFLVFFHDHRFRNAALALALQQGAAAAPIVLGSASFTLSPWTRSAFRRPANAMAGKKMQRKARVCLEGIPNHAWNIESVKGLFDGGSMTDEEQDLNVNSEEEEGCMTLWVWVDRVEDLAKRGTLRLERSSSSSSSFPTATATARQMHFVPELGFFEEHEVLLHLDSVIDFTPLPV